MASECVSRAWREKLWRMFTDEYTVQGETHIVNNTVYNCHTSCDLLNAGTWQSTLETLVQWLEAHPYDVVTYLVVNSDFASGSTVTNYTAAIAASGIQQYLYEPDFIPQHRSQWPTLGEMILTGKRVVMFMDYNANQTAVPYVLGKRTDTPTLLSSTFTNCRHRR